MPKDPIREIYQVLTEAKVCPNCGDKHGPQRAACPSNADQQHDRHALAAAYDRVEGSLSFRKAQLSLPKEAGDGERRYVAAWRSARKLKARGQVKEDIEQIDELSKATMMGYYDKAGKSAVGYTSASTMVDRTFNDAAAHAWNTGSQRSLDKANELDDRYHKFSKKRDKRLEGAKRARARLTSEAMLERAAHAVSELLDDQELNSIYKHTPRD